MLRGNLSLICFQDLGPWYAPRLLSGFRQRHPEVAMTLFETDLAGVNRRLNEGKAELALTYDVGLTHRSSAEFWHRWRRMPCCRRTILWPAKSRYRWPIWPRSA